MGFLKTQFRWIATFSSVKTYLHIGGLVAAGFDTSGLYLLTVTHSGRGVFSTVTWERVARDYSVVYPKLGESIGIGPIDSQKITVTEINFQIGTMRLKSPDGSVVLDCESSGISVEKFDA